METLDVISVFDEALEQQILNIDIGMNIKKRRIAMRWSVEEVVERLRHCYTDKEIEQVEEGKLFPLFTYCQYDVLVLLQTIEDYRKLEEGQKWLRLVK